MPRKKKTKETNFNAAVSNALNVFQDEMERQGWYANTRVGRVKLTDNTKYGLRPERGWTVHGHTVVFKGLFNGPKGSTL